MDVAIPCDWKGENMWVRAFCSMEGDARMVQSDFDVMVDDECEINLKSQRCIVDTRTYDRSNRTGTTYLRWSRFTCACSL